MVSFRLKEEKRCLHAHWSLQPTHFLKDWMPIFIVDPVHEPREYTRVFEMAQKVIGGGNLT